MIRSKKFSAFTLVEVILVVLIIGVLAGIVIPRVSFTTSEANRQAADATVAKVNSLLEYAHTADGTSYPTSSGEFDSFLTNASYFPEGVNLPDGCYMHYDTQNNRAYWNSSAPRKGGCG